MPNCVIIKWKDVADKNYNDKSKYSVVNYNYYTPQLPVSGLAESFEVLIKKVLPLPEGLDFRLYNAVSTNFATDVEDSEEVGYKQYVFTYNIQPTDKLVRKTSVDEAESQAVNSIFPIEKQIKRLAISLALLKKQVQGGTLTTKQANYLNKLDEYVLPLWQNHTLNEAKKAAIDANIEMDIDEGWNKTPINE